MARNKICKSTSVTNYQLLSIQSIKCDNFIILCFFCEKANYLPLFLLLIFSKVIYRNNLPMSLGVNYNLISPSQY